MSIFKITLTTAMMLHEDTVQGDLIDVERWAHKEAKAYGVSLHNITIEKVHKIPDTRQCRKGMKIIRPINND